MSADHRGLPSIAGLCALCAALVAWNVADIAANLKARRAAGVAERNLDQAEGMLKACFKHEIFLVGTAIYRCQASKSELTTAQVPEFTEAGYGHVSGLQLSNRRRTDFDIQRRERP